jgi:hypothetical protein
VSDERREWVAANRDAYTELLIPRAFLDAHACAGAEIPDELSSHLAQVTGRSAAGNCVRACWPVALLQPLADYAETCSRTWSPRRTGPSARVAADTLAQHARLVIERET